MAATTLGRVRGNARLQALLGLLFGIAFGFLLQKSGVVRYEVVIGQLLLYDFTVLRVMVSAVMVGGTGFYLLQRAGLARSHVVTGSAGSTVIGGLIFGAGFALLGYCPGTAAGAFGSGALDAAIGGFAGLVIGSGVYARIYPAIDRTFLHLGEFRSSTLPELFRLPAGVVLVFFLAAAAGFLFLLEPFGR